MKTLLLHDVIEVVANNEKARRYFDKITITEDGNMEVYKYGIHKFNSLCFDFTIDYAIVLSLIEETIFIMQRNGIPSRGIYVKFKSKS